MKRLLSASVCLLLCLTACFRHEEQELHGPAGLDSAEVTLSSNNSLRNLEKASILVVVNRLQPESCGNPALRLTAVVALRDGRSFTFSGDGGSPCSAEAPSDSLGIRLAGLPRESIASIRLRSTQPVMLRSIEWQTWEQGL
jgi:hypothetical protein